MTPADALSDLRDMLSTYGQTVTLQRLSRGAPQTVEAAVTLRAVVRPQGSGDQKVVLVNAMSQQDVTVVLSAEEISAAGWASGAPAGNDTRIPIKGNRIVMQDRTRNVEAASGIYIGGQLVRIEVQARG